MSDKDHQENQSKNVSDDNIDDIGRAQDQVDELAKQDKTVDAVGIEAQPTDDLLAWIDGGDAGMPAAEMPTLQYPGERARVTIDEPDTPVSNQRSVYAQGFDDSQPLDNYDDVMAWLDKLAASKGDPLEELPTQIIPKDMPLDTANMTSDDVLNPQIEMDVLDDPISWLEQLAADQDTPLEELPSVADRLLASEIISKIDDSQGTAVPKVDPPEVTVPLEDALLYLEQVAEDEGVLLQVVALDPLTIPTDLDALLKQVDLLAAGKIASLPVAVAATAVAKERTPPAQTQVDWNNLSESMPEDPDEALAWMESMSDEVDDSPGITPGLTDTDLAELDTLPPTTVHAGQEAEILEEMPEDPDEAMAWLERVSAESAASVESEGVSQAPADKIAAVPEQSETLAVAAASQALADGDIDKALVSYKTLISKGENLDAVVADLETAVSENPGIGRLHYLLGDAYMKNGQHQKALEAYQQGSLDNS